MKRKPLEKLFEPIVKSLSYDWKELPTVDELRKVLKPFGVYVYSDPDLDGSDMYGFIFSDVPLSKKALKEMSVFNNEE